MECHHVRMLYGRRASLIRVWAKVRVRVRVSVRARFRVRATVGARVRVRHRPWVSAPLVGL